MFSKTFFLLSFPIKCHNGPILYFPPPTIVYIFVFIFFSICGNKLQDFCSVKDILSRSFLPFQFNSCGFFSKSRIKIFTTFPTFSTFESSFSLIHKLEINKHRVTQKTSHFKLLTRKCL